MCVGSVYTQPPYNDKNPPSVFFFLSTKIFTPFSNRAVFPCDVTRTEAPPMIVDWLTSVSAQTALVSYLRPALSELSSVVSPPEQM